MKRKLYNSLLNWKKSKINMPYMLIGARQTGKTYLIMEFCRNEFENHIYINLDLMENVKDIFEKTINPDEIISSLEFILGKSINIEKTIIFIDEIQVSERAISSLKYFCESDKRYKIIVAGSLLGVNVNRFTSSFPVGKVWIEYLRPMDFEEFLYAIGETQLLYIIKECYNQMMPMVEVIHKRALRLYNDYICIGGMPAVILQYIECGKDINKFEDNILMSYLVDMSKYTENTEIIKKNKIYNSIPAQLVKENKRFKYSLVERAAKPKDYDFAMEWLISSSMLLKCQRITTPKSPLKAYTENDFKIYLNDVGLLRVLSNISISEILLDKNMIYKEVFIENYIAENLYNKYKELYYWNIDNMYEINFIVNIDGDIIPIEVKLSNNTTAKNLDYYVNRYKPKYSIVLSEENFEEVNGIKSIPLYASFLI